MQQVTVALVDDQPLFVAGFRALCIRARNIKLVAAVSSIKDALNLIRQHVPDIIFFDVAVPDCTLEALTTLMTQAGKVKIVALTASRNVSTAVQALDAGVHGYLLKQSSIEEIHRATEAIARGERYITHGVANKLVGVLHDTAARKAAARAIKLSIREGQVVRLLLSGKTNREIASILSITENTVKHYMSLLMQKLNVRNRLEVVIAAQKLANGDAEAADSSEFQLNIAAHQSAATVERSFFAR